MELIDVNKKPTSQILVPTVIEQEGRMERAYDIFSRLA
jgi:hypothetical protein